MIMDDILLHLFYFVDTFCKISDAEKNILPLPKNITRFKTMHKSEILTICVLYHLSGYKNFKKYYEHILKYMRREFPTLVSYQRFVILEQDYIEDLHTLILMIPKFLSGNYIIDSTPIKVCHNKRIFDHSVFKEIAERGKSSMGFFFGFKFHLVINDLGEVMNFTITKGNVDDRFVVENLTQNLTGKLFADKGYISATLFSSLWQAGLHLVHSIRKNMKPKILTRHDSDKLKKRNLVETVINVLKNTNNIEHSRHRSVKNGFINMLSAVAAYSFKRFYELNFC